VAEGGGWCGAWGRSCGAWPKLRVGGAHRSAPRGARWARGREVDGQTGALVVTVHHSLTLLDDIQLLTFVTDVTVHYFLSQFDTD